MFLHDLIRRRLVSLLRPWLPVDHEPDLVLELGFITSRITATNLRFDASALNRLFQDESSSSSPFYFKEVTIEHFALRFSNWSVPAFKAEVRGVHVTLSAREVKDRVRKSGEAIKDEKKKAVARIDPQGSELHAVLESILARAPSRNRLKNFLLNLVLKNCQLQIFESSLQVEVVPLNDSLVCLMELEDFKAESEHEGGLLRGFVDAAFKTFEVTSVVMDFKGFEIGYKVDGQVKSAIASSDVFASIKLHDLQVLDLNIRVPEFSLSFTPADLPVLAIFGKISSKESRHVRSGRQLWRLVASRLGYVISSPRLSLHNLVGFVFLWLRYLSAYECLLSLHGYSSDNLFKRSAIRISQDEMFLKSVKHSWEVIATMERELPAEAIAQARRISRYRVAMNIERGQDSYNASSTKARFRVLSKILAVLVFLWTFLGTIFLGIINYLSLIKSFFQKQHFEQHLGINFEGYGSQYCLLLNFGKVLITVSPFPQDLNKHIRILRSDIHSFHLSIDALLLVYIDEVVEQSFSIYCGKLKVMESSLMGATSMESSSKDPFETLKGHDTLLWCKPAQTVLPSPSEETSAAGHMESISNPLLKDFIREMWLSWKSTSMKYEDSEIWYSEIPWLLCEVKNYMTHPSSQNPDSGFWKCTLTVGKLNLALGYSTILSISMLLGQMYCVLNWNEESGRENFLPLHFFPSNEDVQEISWKGKFELFANRVKAALHSMIPEKSIQVGVFITGPQIHSSLRKVEFDGASEVMNPAVSQGDFHLRFDIHDVEFVVWPPSGSDFELTEWQISDNAELECHKLQEPWIIQFPKLDNEKYASQGSISFSSYLRVGGLDVYMGESVQSQIFVLKPIHIHSSCFREFTHSFSNSVLALSTTFCAVSTGITIVSFMDELSVLLQVVAGLCSAVSYAFGCFGLIGYIPFQDFLRQNMVFTEPYLDETNTAGELLIYNNTLSSISGILKLNSIDVVLQNSRVIDKLESPIKTYDGSSFQKLGAPSFPDCRIWISLKKTCMEVVCKEEKLKARCDLLGIKFVLFRCQDLLLNGSDHAMIRNLLQESHNWLYEISLSDCMFTLWLGQHHNVLNHSSTVEDSHLIAECATSSAQSSGFAPMEFASSIQIPPASCWLLVNVTLGGIFVASYSAKNIMVVTRKFNKLTSLISVAENLQAISWDLRGGILFIEAAALVMFAGCFVSYLHFIKSLLAVLKSSVNFQSAESESRETSDATQQTKWELPKAFTIEVSHFALVFSVEDGSGSFQELVVEVDAYVKLEPASNLRKFIFKLTRMSIYSQVFERCLENENQIPHFSSVTSNESSADFVPGDHAAFFQHVSGSYTSYRNQILNHLMASSSAEMHENGALHLKQVWVGSGSVSGCDITLSISEIQMISSIYSSFSSINLETTPNPRQRNQSNNQETDISGEDVVPNGAIVAIQDVYQHMYLAVQGENKFTLGGVMHYSLVGENALFRVKHHRQRIWKSSVLWFSLMSLHAKNNSGELLRLNYHPGSGFVEISSTSDGGHSLWRAVSCEPESYSSDIEWEPNNILVKNTFYLVNKKCDSGVAFVNETPEFVGKPGNPFKFKVFQDISLVHDVGMPYGYSLEASKANLHLSAPVNDQRSANQPESPPCVKITIQSVVLNIVHELLDTKDRFYLLRGCINNTELNVQILSYKTRIMVTSNALFYYFDAQRDLWREFGHPVKVCFFYRSSFHMQNPESMGQGIPVHFYCRANRLEVSVTEHSMDVLLFVIGKLDLAGPFSVRSSTIFSNCCKVENQSGLNLLCYFSNEKSVTIARKQSASIFLRHPVLGKDEHQEVSLVKIQLSDLGSFATSSLHVPILTSRTLAWRTLITSPQDSKTYPGPFIVVDISRKSEDGLSIVVSPLIRINNETEFSMDLRFRRPQQDEDVSASVMLKKGDSIDDSMALFDAINLSGELKKALMSLTVGNFLFSFRPIITDQIVNAKSSLSVEWSDELRGGKAVRLSGIFDKLGYQVRRALSVDSVKCSFSTACCTLKSGADVSNLHFLIQSIGRDVPIVQPDAATDGSQNRNSPVSLQEQKQIFLLPTVRVSNLLQLEINVLLTENDLPATGVHNNIGKQATIPTGSSADFYANPSVMYFTVTLTTFHSSCKPVNSGDWIKKLLKKKTDVDYLDIDLDFGGGKCFAILRLSRGLRGILEGTIFTPYSLKNDSDFPLLCFTPNQKSLSWEEVSKLGSSIRPEFGLLLPPHSTQSWLLRSNKLQLKLLDFEMEALLDLDALSGLTEIIFESKGSEVTYITKFGVAMGPSSKVAVPSQTVTMVSRHVVFNESEESISVRQCYLEDENAGTIHINSKQKAALQVQTVFRKTREVSLFENIIQKHRNDSDASLLHIQFQLNESGLRWSGPVCITSLGYFFLKFRKQSLENDETVFAAAHVVEEGSSLGVHFHKPPNSNLPYRIENQLRDASITFYQKDSSEREVLGSNSSVYYVWDDLTLPHKLVVLINDMNLREINMDKIRAWKPFLKTTQLRGLLSHSFMDKMSRDQITSFRQLNSFDISKVGFEVYAEGPTRVLRICEASYNHKEDKMLQSCAKIQLRVLHFAIHLLEHGKQGLDDEEESPCTPIIVMRLGNMSLDSVFTDQKKYNQICVQSANVDLKWIGSPFAAMLRRHQLDFSVSNVSIVRIAFVLLSSSSDVRQVRYASILLQPIDLNLDEETLMRIASFWRKSLNYSNSPRRQYYFDHFEVHPIKIIVNFLPGDSYSSYDSAQETLRSLLHTVVKVPPIKNMVVELNGVLVTHALITVRELFIRCAKHYSWYTMRAIYIAKGSPLLPPAFASIFDDLSSSSLDIFFDPSRGLLNVPGFTLGTFKFISKCINDKGFSGTKRYFGDMGNTLRTVGSNVLFAAVTEVSDSVLKGAEASGFDGMMRGFHQGILKLAMEPAVLGTALMGGGPNRKVKLDRSPGIDELYIEGYLQAMLDTMYRQEYLRVRVIDDQVLLKNLPPNSTLIDEIMDRVKGFLISKGLLKGDLSVSSRPLRHLRGESEWKIGPTVLTLCEHLFVSFVIRLLRKQTGNFMATVKWKKESESDAVGAMVPADSTKQEAKGLFAWKWRIGEFVLSGILAYVDGRLCRYIPNPIARRIVSGYLLSFLDKNDGK